MAIKGINKHTSGAKNTLEDLMTLNDVPTEGIVYGFQAFAQDTPDGTITLTEGACAINVGVTTLYFESDAEETLVIPNLGNSFIYNVVLKVDLTNATEEIEVLQGTTTNDPTLTEGGNPEIYYLPLVQINTDSGSVITQAMIKQNSTFSDPLVGNREIVGSYSTPRDGTRVDFLNQFNLNAKIKSEFPPQTLYIEFDGRSVVNDIPIGTAISFAIDYDSFYYISAYTITLPSYDSSTNKTRIDLVAMRNDDDSIFDGIAPFSELHPFNLEIKSKGGINQHRGYVRVSENVTGISSISKNVQKLYVDDGRVTLDCSIEGTGLTGTNSIRVDLPINAELAGVIIGTGRLNDNGSIVAGISFIQTTTEVLIRRYDSANFSGGTHVSSFVITYPTR